MLPRRTSVLIASTALLTAIVGVASPSHAGPPGTWTEISGGGISSIVEPSLYRTADGTVHVTIQSGTPSTDSIEVAHVSASGALTGRHTAIPNWSGTTSDPDLVAAPGGGMRLVFGGHRTTVTGDPYNEGYVYYATADGTGASWTLAPNTAPAVANLGGYVSSGTGVTTLADGTLVTAFPFHSTIHYQLGAGPVQSFDTPACCVYDMSLATDGSGAVYAAWYSNGGVPGAQGILVRQIHPTLGPVVQAPGGVTGNDQAMALVTRPDGGVYLAYPRGELNNQGYGLWQLGTGTVRKVPGSKGATHLAMSTAPGGRLWLAFRDDKFGVRVVRTNPSATKFGAVQKVKSPKGATVYQVGIEGSTGRGDLVINDSTHIWHQQVLAGLSLKASPKKWNGGNPVTVTFKVTDAGAAIKGAKVKAKGKKCTTNKKGKCTLYFAKVKPGKFNALATRKEYAAGSVRIRVT
jgi:hypothetical protein